MLHNDPDGSLVEELFDHAPTPTTEQHLLSEPIAALCLPPPITVSPGTSIREAVRVMVDAHIGAVPIVEDGRLLGIFTERDVLCRVTLQGLDIDATPVEDVMTADPVSVELRTLRVHALRVMVQRGFRHLCVLDEDRIVGVFSMRELVRFVQDLFPRHLSSDAA